jgi:hypothetical protein
MIKSQILHVTKELFSLITTKEPRSFLIVAQRIIQ